MVKINIYRSLPLITILLLFISSFVFPLIKKKNIAKLISLLTMGLSTVFSIMTLFYVKMNGEFIFRVGHFDAPWGIELKIGILESVMAILFTLITALIIWYSIYSIDKEIKEKRIPYYYLLINLLIGSLLGIVYSNDLFNCFVFIEISTLTSCGIIVIKDTKDNIKATLKYLILSCLGSGLFLMAIAFIYSITGNLNMDFVHKELIDVFSNYRNTVMISMALFTVGLGVKSAMFPLHTWLPDAHSNAPSTSSAILSALVLKGFVFLLIKVLYRVYGLEIINEFIVMDMLLVLGSLGMLIGSILAIAQDNIKRVIAYSSIAQMGYIFFGIGLGTKYGLTMAFFHILGHAFTKSSLFLSVGSMIEQTGKKKLNDLLGVGKEMPVTLGIFTIGALSMVGIPILPGFISKWYLSLASIDAGKEIFLVVILISSLLNAKYYLPIVVNGFFGEENLKGKVFMAKNKPIKELLPVLILTIGMIFIGLFSKVIIEAIETGLI
ncbi:MAG: monovalent cation/H+ antiporter subunit D family protein [Firmicutes bacterium]|nr:monovalent cation/H+ antiporter subunit D family protein [Bacillota bacterium]